MAEVALVQLRQTVGYSLLELLGLPMRMFCASRLMWPIYSEGKSFAWGTVENTSAPRRTVLKFWERASVQLIKCLAQPRGSRPEIMVQDNQRQNSEGMVLLFALGL